MERSVWEPLLLVATTVLAVGLPWRVHLSAVRAPQQWLAVPDALVSLTIVAATTWAVVALIDGRSPTQVLPAVGTAALAAGADVVRARCGLSPRTPVLPMWFVPAALVVAVAGAAWWEVADGPMDAARVGVIALVMAAPTAALLSVPLAFATGASRAKKAGVRITDLATLEAATVVDTLVLAKDGTVTTGDLTVVSVDPVEPDHDRNLRWFAGALAKASDHRVDRAVATLSARGQLTGVEVVDGVGVLGSVDRHPVRVGVPHWIGIETTPTLWTTVGVEVDGRTLGSITVADDVRPYLTRDIGRLRSLGLELVLVSDDTDERTRHVAGLAGIDAVHVTTDPGSVVSDLVAAGRHVATVGLARSDGASLGITVAADPDDSPASTIVADDCSPARVADAIALARRTASRIRRVRTTTAVLGLVGAAVAATGVAGPVVAAAVAVGLCVVAAAIATSA